MKKIRSIIKSMLCFAILAALIQSLPPFAQGVDAQIAINFCQPANNGLVDNDLTIGATIDSTYELNQVEATVEDRETSLTFSDHACHVERLTFLPGWAGTISLLGLSRGQKTLTVTATDVFGNPAQAQRIFIYDQIPKLTVTAPLAETVARPELHIGATCTDDDPAGCVSIKVRVGGNIIATGTSNVDQTISLSDYDGQCVVLQFEGLDSVGQKRLEERTVYVESSTKLIEVESVSGRIWNVQPERILFLESSGGTNILKIKERPSGQETIVMNEPGKIPQYGFLTPKGAVFLEQSGDSLTTVIYEWRDGLLINIGHPDCVPLYVKVKGNYAIWNEYCTYNVSSSPLYLRDILSGNTIEIISASGGENDVAANGDVVYWTSDANYNIYRYREGIITQLTFDDNLWNTYPLTDGINVV